MTDWVEVFQTDLKGGLPTLPEGARKVTLIGSLPLMLSGIAGALRATPDLVVCGEAHDVSAAATLVRTLQPALGVVVLRSANTALAVLSTLRGVSPDLRLLVLSFEEEPSVAGEMLRAGARG